MLRFSYQTENLAGPAPPSLPTSAVVRWRPLIPITVFGPTGLSDGFYRTILDSAADDTVFPIDLARRLGVRLHSPSGHGLRWRGQLHPLRFGDVELSITDSVSVWRWPAMVSFSPAQIRYPILGQAGCLQFFDARFLGAGLAVELEANQAYPGTQT